MNLRKQEEYNGVTVKVIECVFEEYEYDFFPGTGSGRDETPGGSYRSNRKLKYPYYMLKVEFSHGAVTSWNFDERTIQEICSFYGKRSPHELVGASVWVYEKNDRWCLYYA